MSREASVAATQIVARSLKISATTHLLVASIAAGVAANAAVALRFLGLGGQAVLLAVVFASLAAGSSAVAADVYSRSSQVMNSLKSIGATRSSLSSAVVFAVIGYGAGGATLGAVAGLGIGAGLGPGAPDGAALLELVAVILAACAGMSAGVFLGARRAWSA